jgi:hypothetical protein
MIYDLEDDEATSGEGIYELANGLQNKVGIVRGSGNTNQVRRQMFFPARDEHACGTSQYDCQEER